VNQENIDRKAGKAMTRPYGFLTILTSLLPLVLACCTKENTLVGPSGSGESTTHTPTPKWYCLDLTGHREAVDSRYQKGFSDGTWERYEGTLTVNGTLYNTIIAIDSTRYFYTMNGGLYAGCQQKRDIPVIFDVPLDPLPTRWRSDTTVTRSAKFVYQGYSVSMHMTHTLLDTGSLATSLGTFSTVAHFLVQAAISAGSGNNSTSTQEVWTACGPGRLKIKPAGKSTVYFVQGYVNGASWGNYTSTSNRTPSSDSPACTSLNTVERTSLLPETLAGGLSRTIQARGR
jgi:hypothetical protein